MPSRSITLPNRQAAVAVIQDGNKFLTILRSETVRAPGKICFPGGGVEPGETIAEALVREMQEELSIEVEAGETIWRSDSVRGFELHWCMATIKPNQVITPNPLEVASIQWLTGMEMLDLPNLLDTNREFLDALDSNEFSLKQ
jgi:mutator protein MutT